MKTILLLYSGGDDSTLLLLMALRFRRQVHCLIFDYGQKHKQEIDIAIQNCNNLDVEYTLLKIDIPISSKLTSGEDHQYIDLSPWHVPSRNLMFVSMAASIAESGSWNTIWLGANHDDLENHFPDCSQRWLSKVNKLLKVNGPTSISLESPLLGMTKQEIAQLLNFFKTDKIKTFSGYGTQK